MKPIVCYVTDSQSLGLAVPRSHILAKIEAAVVAGVDWVQIREKEMQARQLVTIARAAVGMASRKPLAPSEADRPGSLVLVNDRLDVALAADAAGLHLGRQSLAAHDVIGWRRSGKTATDFMVGLPATQSTNCARQRMLGLTMRFSVQFLAPLQRGVSDLLWESPNLPLHARQLDFG